MNKMIKNVKGLNVISEGPKEAKEIDNWVPWGNLKFDSFSLYKQEGNFYLFARFRREESRGHGYSVSEEQAKELQSYKDVRSVIDFWSQIH